MINITKSLIRQAIILAGGLGTRLFPITLMKPKPLIPLLNEPLIEHILRYLPEEVDEIIITLGFKKEDMFTYFKNHPLIDKIIFLKENVQLGTGGAIKNAEKFINDTFLVISCDVIFSLNIKQFFNFHHKKGGIGSIAVIDKKDPTQFGMVKLNESNKITLFQEKPKKNKIVSNLVSAGAYILEPKIFDKIPSKTKISMEKEIIPILIKQGMFGYKFKGYCLDVGTPKAYLGVHKFLLTRIQSKQFEHNSNLTNIFLKSPILISDSSVLNDFVSIGPFVSIGKNVKIYNNVIIKGSVIHDNVKIKNRAKIIDSIICENCEIKEDLILRNKIVTQQEERKINNFRNQEYS